MSRVIVLKSSAALDRLGSLPCPYGKENCEDRCCDTCKREYIIMILSAQTEPPELAGIEDFLTIENEPDMYVDSHRSSPKEYGQKLNMRKKKKRF